jgi:hypothetical protein
VVERKHNRQTIRRVLSRMTHRVLAGAFACYAGAVGTVVAQRERVARTMARWKSPGLKRAMEAWMEYVEVVHGERAQEAQELARQYMQDKESKHQEKAGLEAERRIGICKRVVARMLKQQLALAWAFFCDCIRTIQRTRTILRRVIGRIKTQSACAALGRWSQIASKCRRLRLAVQRAIGRWRRTTYNKAWSTWHLRLVRQRHLRGVIRKICVRILHRSCGEFIAAAMCVCLCVWSPVAVAACVCV